MEGFILLIDKYQATTEKGTDAVLGQFYCSFCCFSSVVVLLTDPLRSSPFVCSHHCRGGLVQSCLCTQWTYVTGNHAARHRMLLDDWPHLLGAWTSCLFPRWPPAPFWRALLWSWTSRVRVSGVFPHHCCIAVKPNTGFLILDEKVSNTSKQKRFLKGKILLKTWMKGISRKKMKSLAFSVKTSKYVNKSNDGWVSWETIY